MSRVYVLDADTLATIGLIDQSFAKLQYTRRYRDVDTLQMSINRKRLYASEITNGRLLYLPDEGDLIFLVEQVETLQSGEIAKDTMTVTCRSIEGIALVERLCLPPVGEAYDTLSATPAETAMKHYVDVNAVSATDLDRDIPSLVIAADAARGVDVDTAARYETVLDFLVNIGLVSGLGWQIIFNRTDGQFVFDTLEGADLSASVFFDFEFETLEKWDELASDLDKISVAIVAGQGEGVDRDIVTRGGGVGFAHREAFVDARDVVVGNTTLLNARGDAILAGNTGETSIEATLHQFGSFRYRRDWSLGDIVLVRNEERGIAYASRIVEVEVTINSSQVAPVIVATLGLPFPSMKSRSASGVSATADSGSGGGGGGVSGDDLIYVGDSIGTFDLVKIG